MNIDVSSLPDDPVLLKQLLVKARQEMAAKDAKLAYLLEQFRLAQQKQFGKSAEGFAGQGELFNEAEELVESVETEQETVSYTRNKPKRKPLPKDLPREQIVVDIDDEDKVCDCCHGQLHQMGEDVSEKLEFVPAQIKVIEYVRPKYACRHCEQVGTHNTIKQAKMPAMPINKGIATASLLSQLITSKYQYGLPLHRQEAMFKQHGIELSRKTMSEWILKSARLFAPLIDRLKAELRQQSAIHADETPVNVVKSDKAKSYMWLYCSGTDSPQDNNPHRNIVLYDFNDSRAAACPINYLGNYQGYLHVDGYAAYEKTQATLVGCWAHARRKFIEAKQVQGKNKTGKADVVLNLIQKLYGIESRIKGKTVDEKYQLRQKQSKPIQQNHMRTNISYTVNQENPV